MATSTPERQHDPMAGTADGRPCPGHERPAATAAARVSGASLLLGGLGLVSAILVLVRLMESWRVGSGATSHRIEVFGQGFSYPAANVNAIVILLLAALGSVVTVRALGGAMRECHASRRFSRAVSRRQLETLRDAVVVPDPQPRAFCAGLLRPRVYVSAGAVAVLDEAALDAVLAHERHHARRRDPLRFAAGRVLADALFFLPELGLLVERQQALAELSADESAVDGVRRSGRRWLGRCSVSPMHPHPVVGAGLIQPASTICSVSHPAGDFPRCCVARRRASSRCWLPSACSRDGWPLGRPHWRSRSCRASRASSFSP